MDKATRQAYTEAVLEGRFATADYLRGNSELEINATQMDCGERRELGISGTIGEQINYWRTESTGR